MAERNRRHILLHGGAHAEPYQRPPQRIPEAKLPTVNRANHGRDLRIQLETAAEESLLRRTEQTVNIAGSQPGIRVVFDSFPGIELAFESLDPKSGRSHPELLSVREVMAGDQVVEQATVFIPEGKLGYFLG